MALERKTVMISARMPASLVDRADYVIRNTTGDASNRSAALQEALESWVSVNETALEKLGVMQPKKAARA